MDDIYNCWKPIPEFNRCEINKNGDVRNIKSGHIIQHTINEGGYHVVRIVRDDGKHKSRKVHRLVLITFVGYDPNPERKNCNHLDGNKNHNYLTNLEWTTYSENERHAIDMGLMSYDFERVSYHVQVDDLDFVSTGALRAAEILHEHGYYTDVSTKSLCASLRNCANEHRLYFGKIKVERLDDPYDVPRKWFASGNRRVPIKAKLPSGLILKARGCAQLADRARQLGYWKDRNRDGLIKMISETAHRVNGTCYGISVWFEQSD